VKIIGVDPGDKTTGYAVLENGEWEAVGSITNAGAIEIDPVFDIFTPDVMVIEDVFLGPRKGLKGLLRNRYIWSTLAELRGCDIVVVQPRTWRVCHGITAKGAKKKLQTIPLAEELTEMEVEEHEADAVLMVEWYIGKFGGKDVT
jgi:Holliday junction resolvasome RuvABC endonuclease subunit